jgi:hypothetical protein
LELLSVLAECSPEHAKPNTVSALRGDTAEADIAAIRARIIAAAVVVEDDRARRLAAAIEARVSDIAGVRDEGEDGDDSGENALKFSVDEEGDADGGRRNKPGAPKRRVPAAGGGGRRPAQKK